MKTKIPLLLSFIYLLTPLNGFCQSTTNAATSTATMSREDWNRKTLVDAYRKSGKKGDGWNGPVEEGLSLASSFWVDHPKIEGDENIRLCDLFQTASTAGCNDPLFLYAYALASDGLGRYWAVRRNLWDRCALQIGDSSYHSIYKCDAYLSAACMRSQSTGRKTQASQDEVKRLLDLAAKELPIALQDKEVPRQFLSSVCGRFMGITGELLKEPLPYYQKLDEEMTKAGMDESTKLTMKGRFYISYAWNARGSGWASTVTEEGWKWMHERLGIAETALTKAWTLDPKNARAATEMINVVLGQSGNLQQLELWFSRAMLADPDNYAACSSKLYFLEPKWHGSPEQMLSFGYECLKTGHWSGKIPFILIEAHQSFAKQFVKSKIGETKDYYKHPGVWNDVKSVYEPYLKLYPKAAMERTEFVRYACFAEDWPEANRQLDILSTNVVRCVFDSDAECNSLLKAAAEKKNQKP